MMTVLPVLDDTLLSTQTIFGLGIAVGLLTALAISAKRWLLGYLIGGLIYWGVIDGLHHWLTQQFLVSDWHGFVIAFALSLLPLFFWVSYRVLRYDMLNCQKQKPALTEHSPVYDSGFQPRFR